MMNMQSLRTADIIICQGYWFVESGQWQVEQKLVIGGQNFEEQTHTWLIREADKKM